MKTNAHSLAMRDPAMAALMGIDDFGADFGAEGDWHDDGGSMVSDFGAEFGWTDEHGAEFGDSWGADAPVSAGLPSKSQAIAAWHAHQQSMQHTSRRASLLEPNKGSTIKVERYSFPINQTLTLGTAVALSLSGQPDTTIRPQRVTMNAPSPGFCTISEIKVANVSVTIGGGNSSDAWEYNALGVGQSLDMPTLSPANKATVLGNYTAFVPPGFVGGNSYLFAATFKGPSSIVA